VALTVSFRVGCVGESGADSIIPLVPVTDGL